MSLNPKSFYRGWLHTEQDPEGPPPDTGRRWTALRGLVVLSFLLLAGRLWQLQVLQNERYSRAAFANSVRRLPIEAQRGVFYDRNGVQLTENKPLWEVSLTRADMPEDEAAYGAALLRLERHLRRGAVAFLDASELPESGRATHLARVARAVGVTPDVARRIAARSEAEEAAVLLREEIPLAELPRLRTAVRGMRGVDAMPAVQWLLEEGGESPFRPAVVAERVPRETALAIEGERLRIPGVSIAQVPARRYLDAALYSGVLGYVGKIGEEQLRPLQTQARRLGQRPYALDETVGKTGLEAELEGYLRGAPGTQEVEVTSSNRVVRQGKLTDASAGHNVTLTLDARLQAEATEALDAAVRRSGARGGAVVALDPRDGRVLALVSLPSYDNNLFVRGLSQGQFARLQADPGRPLLNKAIAGQYTPGTVLKPFVAAGALAERVVDGRVRYRCDGRIEVVSPSGSLEREAFEGSPPRKLGSLDVRGALARNCDEYFYAVAGPSQLDVSGRPMRYYMPGDDQPTPFNGLGVECINRFLGNFGFGKPTGIPLPGEATGLVADNAWKLERFPSQPWTLGDTLRTAVGDGYTLATPLQMATATGAVANGGAVYRPQLVLRVTDAAGRAVLEPQAEQVGGAGMTPDHLATVRSGMAQAVERGAAKGLRDAGLLPSGVRVGAMVGSPPAAESADSAPLPAWFTAFAPYERPELAVAVVLDGGRRDADYAAPVGAAVLTSHLSPADAE